MDNKISSIITMYILTPTLNFMISKQKLELNALNYEQKLSKNSMLPYHIHFVIIMS